MHQSCAFSLDAELKMGAATLHDAALHGVARKRCVTRRDGRRRCWRLRRHVGVPGEHGKPIFGYHRSLLLSWSNRPQTSQDRTPCVIAELERSGISRTRWLTALLTATAIEMARFAAVLLVLALIGALRGASWFIARRLLRQETWHMPCNLSCCSARAAQRACALRRIADARPLQMLPAAAALRSRCVCTEAASAVAACGGQLPSCGARHANGLAAAAQSAVSQHLEPFCVATQVWRLPAGIM